MGDLGVKKRANSTGARGETRALCLASEGQSSEGTAAQVGVRGPVEASIGGRTGLDFTARSL